MGEERFYTFKQSLTEEGRQSFIDNGINMEMLQEFSEEDVKDVFQTFSDRFKARKFIAIHKEFARAPELDFSKDRSTVSEPSNDSDLGDDNDQQRHYLPENKSVCVEKKQHSVPYTVDQMLEKKNQRGKPTPAQLYFRQLLRDAAVSSKIWKRAPTLVDISENKRTAFFTAFEVAPGLLQQKKELWTRLGESLQNRRKYLLDKGKKGKRSESSHETSTSNVNLNEQLKVGAHVVILSKNKTPIGDGVLIMYGLMYSEVVVKTIYDICNSLNDTDIELPSPVDDHTTLNARLVKRVITWRSVRLCNKTLSSGASVKKSKIISRLSDLDVDSSAPVKKSKISSRSSDLDVDSSASVKKSKISSRSLDLDVDSSTSVKKSKISSRSLDLDVDSSASVKKSKISSRSLDLDVDSSVSVKKSKISSRSLDLDVDSSASDLDVDSSASLTSIETLSEDGYKDVSCFSNECQSVEDSDSDTNSVSLLADLNSELEDIGIYEWAKGDVFLGVLDGQSIVNCQKPVARIIVKPKLEMKIYLQDCKTDKGIVTLNLSDVQKDPDANYCVMKVKLPFDKARDMIKINNVPLFVNKLKSKFEQYAFKS